MHVISRPTIIKRLTENVEFRYEITTFGADNLYPQRAEQVALRSPITKSAIKKLSKFLGGLGFEENGDLVVNRFDQTLNDILRMIRMDKAGFDGWSLHFNVNELMMITEIVAMKFKNVRFGLPDDLGHHKDVKVNINWENDFNKTLNRVEVIQEFPLWHRRNDLEPEDIEDIEDFKGFVFYWTPVMDEYPLATYDAVLDSAQTNGEIQVFELSSIQNGFLGTSIFKYPGKFASAKERQNAEDKIFELTGPNNAGAVMIMELPVDFDGQLIEQIPANNSDRLFELTNETSQARIVSNYGIPFPILGLQPTAGGVFNQEQLEDSYIYFNTDTREERQSISVAFNKFLQFWHTGPISVGEIVENEFTVKVEPDGSTDNTED